MSTNKCLNSISENTLVLPKNHLCLQINVISISENTLVLPKNHLCLQINA